LATNPTPNPAHHHHHQHPNPGHCRTIYNSFTDLHKPTIGADFHFRKLEVNGVSVALQLWDITGQDHFGPICRVYYKDAFGAMLVFDLSREDTFVNVLKWKREIDSKVTLPDGKPLPVVLLANKCDLPDVKVHREMLDTFCKEHGFVTWYETSARTNHKIEEGVHGLVNAILSHQDAFEAQRVLLAAKTPGGVALGGADSDAAGGAGSGGGCCGGS